MDASFIELAGACRETHTIGLQVLGRLVGVAEEDRLAAMRAREGLLLATADLLVEMAPHEALVRSFVRVGGLAELPAFSADVSQLAVETIGLWRGTVLDVMPLECEVRFDTRRASTRAWISRANLIGIERRKPSIWLPR